MAETATKLPVKKGEEGDARSWLPQAWHPFESLRREVDRLFRDFDRDFSLSPFQRPMHDVEPLWRGEWTWASGPAVDFVETDSSYEITAELPGMDEKDIEVKLANGGLMIRGEKHVEKEQKDKGYYLHERHFGSFERAFRMPEGVDADKIEATFKKGVLTVTLPKTPEARKAEKKIPIKGA
ncbi:Hsp20/alpha crystallin family protein [Cupriavidus sp. L7L]|uniref:Hsp20/alpha crystallin family protein n=1 Tax=Cupriavidus sp. L7L TaxID=2546443 RepID=UPI0010552439|nr:Hsp20/alpha crystallin family protein [Cupriavidus sp. L7L]TDF67227.1 Hsp20/alpha crystallin family protein [Cupriavidus sp. L7L]